MFLCCRSVPKHVPENNNTTSFKDLKVDETKQVENVKGKVEVSQETQKKKSLEPENVVNPSETNIKPKIDRQEVVKPIERTKPDVQVAKPDIQVAKPIENSVPNQQEGKPSDIINSIGSPSEQDLKKNNQEKVKVQKNRRAQNGALKKANPVWLILSISAFIITFVSDESFLFNLFKRNGGGVPSTIGTNNLTINDTSFGGG